MIDISKIRPGDEVTVRMRVEAVRAEGVEVCGVFYPRCDIASHTPAPREIKVGDRVKWRGGNRIGSVIAIYCGTAWVYSTINFFADLNELTHAEDSHE